MNQSQSSDLASRVSELESQLSELKKTQLSGVEEKMTLIIFSGEMDRVMAALILATGAVAMGLEVSLFFTFWGTSVLKKPGPQARGKLFLQKLFGWMMPQGPSKLPLSKLNFAGMGPAMMGKLMAHYNTATIPELLDLAQESDVKFYICRMSMDLMGIKEEELLPIKGLDYCGVAAFLNHSDRAMHTFFI
jgi:peroxiredoxin family protein